VLLGQPDQERLGHLRVRVSLVATAHPARLRRTPPPGQAWAEFDAQVKAVGAFVLNGALTPASADARLVQTAPAGHAIGEAAARRPFAAGKWQIHIHHRRAGSPKPSGRCDSGRPAARL